MNPKLKTAGVEFLYDAVLQLKTKEDCENFFEDLCTVPELKAMSQRLVVAKMLREKKVYSEIRVNRALIYGCDGYELALKRIEENTKE